MQGLNYAMRAKKRGHLWMDTREKSKPKGMQGIDMESNRDQKRMKMIFSKKGDHGETSLLGGERVSKYDLRPETYGTLDEASSTLGLARASTNYPIVKETIFGIQKDLVILGAELSTPPQDSDKYGYKITGGEVDRLGNLIDRLQDEIELPRTFIYPGETAVSAMIDMARTIIRRAERRAVRLRDEGLIHNPEILRYLNRCADLLFTLARYQEEKEGRA